MFCRLSALIARKRGNDFIRERYGVTVIRTFRHRLVLIVTMSTTNNNM